MSPSGGLTVVEQGIGSHALRHNGLASHAQEWQRELDRAQARAWFHAAPPAPTDGPGPREAGHFADVAAAPAAPQPAQSTGVAQGANLTVHARTADVPALPGATTAHHQMDAGPSTGRGAANPVDAPTNPLFCMHPHSGAADGKGEILPPPPRRVPVPTSADAEVRMHVERDGEDVRVWIGLDGDEAAVAARAATLLLHLRRALQAEGCRLLAFTCNGRPVDEAPSPSTNQEQTTWRSER